MLKHPEIDSLQELQIKLLFEELNSSEPLARQYAISQLHAFIELPSVVAALKERFQCEDNFSCRNDLDELLKLAESLSVEEIGTEILYSAAEIADNWNTVLPAQLSSLVRQLKKQAIEDQAATVSAIFARAESASRILPLLSLSRRTLARPEVVTWLEKFLASSSGILLVRVLSLLTRIKPAALVCHLPRLLVHESLQVRLLAIKALHLLAPAEAIRLLNELMFSGDAKNQRSAFSFLFLLPFPDTGDIVLRLVERTNLPEKIDQVITYLIYNNPDGKFLQRLAVSYLLHGKRIPRLAHYLETSVKSIVVARLTTKSEEELRAEVLNFAQSYIQSHLKHRIQQVAPISEAKSLVSKNDSLAELNSLTNFSEEHEKQLLSLLPSLKTNAEKLMAMNVIAARNLKDAQFCNWLESLLDNQSAEIVCQSLSTLAQVNKNRILPHLPFLAFSQFEEVARIALQLFGREFPEKFLQKISIWMRDGKPEIRQAAYDSLLQIEFLQARDLILAYCKGEANTEAIKFYGSILLLNPDILTAHKLSRLADSAAGEKKRLFGELSEKIRKELGEHGSGDARGILGESGLSEQWEEILGSIRKISYESKDLTFAELLQSRAFSLLMVAFLALALLVAAFNFKIKDYSAANKKIKPAEKTSFSFSLNQPQKADSSAEANRPWDYRTPELATPSTDLFQIMTIEERQQQQQELVDEYGPESEKNVSDRQLIRLEVENGR